MEDLAFHLHDASKSMSSAVAAAASEGVAAVVDTVRSQSRCRGASSLFHCLHVSMIAIACSSSSETHWHGGSASWRLDGVVVVVVVVAASAAVAYCSHSKRSRILSATINNWKLLEEEDMILLLCTKELNM